jgi:aspartyl-tRNA(Asn)/glutamyl-tRNA(Gln) amidotransferase subunit B
MRGKEEAHDYRYFPDPDLVPLIITADWVAKIEKVQPELPDQKRQRFITQHGLTEYDAEVLTASRALADYFEECAAFARNPKMAANWIMGEVTRALNDTGSDIDHCPVPPKRLADLLQLIEKGTISGKIAKTVFDEIWTSGKEPADVVAEKGLLQVSDSGEIEAVIDQIVAASPDQVAEFRNGKEKVFGFFVGQVMKAMKGKGNPAMVNDLLLKKLKG